MAAPRIRISAAVLDSADPRSLATFYEQLLGWTRTVDEPARPGNPPADGWVMLRPPTGGTGLSFQYVLHYQRPARPAASDKQQMMLHLDIAVDDLDVAVDYARDLGATLAIHPPATTTSSSHARPRRTSVLPLPSTVLNQNTSRWSQIR
jgi:hypothetical protein